MAAHPPGVTEGGLAFVDSRGCKDWLASLPLTSVTQAQGLVLEGVRRLNLSGLAPLERLKCLELIRDKAAFLAGEQRTRLAGKSLPLGAGDTAAWTGSRNLAAEMESGYRALLDALLPGSDLARHAALVRQRIVRCLGAQMRLAAIAYRAPDAALWARAHRVCLEAMRAGHADERVKDSLEAEDGTSSVAEAWVQVALLHAVPLAECSPAEIAFVEALLRLWGRKLALHDRPPADLAHVLVADLAGDAAPLALAQSAGAVGERRFIDTTPLSMSLRKRLHALRNEEDPASLGLPAGAAEIDAAGLLQRLHRAWCDAAPARTAGGRAPAERTAGLVFGLADIHFFVSGGKPFEQPDRSRELTAREKQDIEVFGRVTERTQSRMMVAHDYSVEPWEALDEALGVWRLARPPGAMRGIAHGRVLALRTGDTGAFFVGMVSALAQEADGRIVATVTLFPGKPEPLPVRAGSKWAEAFRLPANEKLRLPPTLVLPAGIAHRGRAVRLWEGAPRDVKVAAIVNRGADFDRVAIA